LRRSPLLRAGPPHSHLKMSLQPLARADILGKLTPGLGPPRPLQREAFLADRAHTDGCPRHPRRGRSPNKVAERFPDWTAVGFRYPTACAIGRKFARRLTAPAKQPLARPLVDAWGDAVHFRPGPVPRITRLSPGRSWRLGRVGSDVTPIGGLSPRGTTRHWRRL
jgi:hypothetical protein